MNHGRVNPQLLMAMMGVFFLGWLIGWTMCIIAAIIAKG